MTPVTGSRPIGLMALFAIAAGCTTWNPPRDTSDASLRARATTETNRDVRLSAAMLSREDGIRMFGTDLHALDVQPVWIEIRNDSRQMLWLLRAGTDPEYFSPLEVAWSAHVTLGGETNARIDEHFDQLAFRSPIPPGETRSGVLFTNPQPETALLNVDLLGDRTMVPFTLFMPPPGEAPDAYQKRVHVYADSELTHCDDLKSLRRALETLPCCTTNAAGAATGEPLNVVLVGRLQDIAAAVIRRGYRNDTAATGAGVEVFGRPSVLILRKRAPGASARWLKLWRAPIAYQEQAVFVGQTGRPIGGRFADVKDGERLYFDVDEARNNVIQDFLYSQGLAQLGFVMGAGIVPAERSAKPSGGANYRTDGFRAVLFLVSSPRTFAEVKVLDWESLPRGTAISGQTESAPR